MPRLVHLLTSTCAIAAAGMFNITLRADSFPTPNDTQEMTIPLLTPAESLAKLKLPEGFKATVFAAEPELNNPIAACWDEKGRLWVAENFTYGDSNERYNYKLRDRILIFEDTDNDGVFDKRTVFSDSLQLLTSIERGHGGIWAVCPPNLLFIPDANNDDIPDGPAEVKLEGFSTQAASRHTFANGLKWGPDGWLYGRCGISSTSYVGTPETPEKDRLAIAGGIWRYHPTRKVYDIVSYGTTNPWGSDWDAEGELFFINTVIGHLWHGIHGARLKRMHGQDLNPHSYQLMDMIADHYHWDTGKKWEDSREGGSGASDLGGGHAHVGMMIYQGTNWPEQYRNKLMTLNLGGRRVNVERLEKKGSSYIGKHEPDMLQSTDPWFRGVEILYGPDGGVYIFDWSDIGECHENDGVHRNSGRVFKVTYGDAARPKEADLTKLSDAELVALQTSDNEWLVRMARWEIRERVLRGGKLDTIAQGAEKLLSSGDRKAQLNAFWLLNSLSEAVPARAEETAPLRKLLHDFALETKDDVLRVRTVETLYRDSLLLTQRAPKNTAALAYSPEEASKAILQELEGQPSARKKLALSTSLPYLNDADRLKLAASLLSHQEDAADAYLPLMTWYGIMDLPPVELVKLFADSKIPLVRQFIARRCTEDADKDAAPLNALLALNQHQAEVIAGMAEGFKGWAKAPKPEAWESFTAGLKEKSGAVDEQLRALNLLFGDGRALDDLKALALDDKADFAARNNALKALITAKADGLQDICRKLLRTRGLNMTALRGLALFDDAAIGTELAKSYRNFYPNEQPVLIDTLTSRKTFAMALLDQIEPRGIKIPRNAISVIHARQIRSFKDEELDKKLTEMWGDIRETSADKQNLIATLKAKLTPETLAKADTSAGRAVYNMACASCHKLYGEGQHIGPDLTGTGRHDLTYLLDNIVDPSALLAPDYKMNIVTMKDGRVLSGNISAKSDRTITLKMVGLEQIVERSEIASIQELPNSLMPEGLLLAFNDDQVRDLIAYLMTSAQVPLPK